jgi:hypothetical protein
MTAGYKVKLEDASIVGPLDLDMLRSWYEQGLVNRDTPVLATGARRWVKLSDVPEFGHVPRGRSKTERAGRSAEVEEEAEYEEESSSSPRAARFGRVLAGAFLIAGSATAVASLLLPKLWRPELAGAPWRELGYIQLVLAFTALHESEWTRKVARIGVCLGAFAVFPVLGMLLADSVPMESLAVLGCVWLVATGLFYLLGPSIPTKQLLVSTAAVLVGVYGIVRFGVVLGVTMVAGL